jgi:osmoprotectant transport system permease protein
MRQRREWGSVDSWRSLAPVAINVANVGQTVPSLAVLGLSMSFLGIGFLPAIVALWVRALLPILQNTVAGILAVDADIIEAAHGMGMTRRQVLFRIELPLAMAVIFAGIRTAVVFNVAVGALAFYIGAGGLGHLIAIGIGLSNARILVTGGILTALMAIAADFVMGHIQERLVPPTV